MVDAILSLLIIFGLLSVFFPEQAPRCPYVTADKLRRGDLFDRVNAAGQPWTFDRIDEGKVYASLPGMTYSFPLSGIHPTSVVKKC